LHKASKLAALASAGIVSSMPTRQTLAGCCARATSGHAAALPSAAMKVRRFIQ
jgi:hypothetical protein